MNRQEQINKIIEMVKEINGNVEVQEFCVGQDRSSYLDANKDMYDDMMENIDDIEFPVDYVNIVRDEYNYNGNSTIGDIIDCIHSYSTVEEDIDDIFNNVDLSVFKEELDEEIDYKEIPLSEIEEKTPELYKSLVEILDIITDDDFDIRNDGRVLFDCEDPDEIVHSNTLDALAYWTVYWSPSWENAEIAQFVGLTSFKYKDGFYLALGGCGMDLSPKLDAYIALTSGVIPSDSEFFRQLDYFKSVVGEKVYNRVIKECSREKKRYVITFNE